MTHALSCHLDFRAIFSLSGAKRNRKLGYMEYVRRKFVIMAVTVMLAPFVFAQGSPHVTAVDPPAGKVNDSVTVSGENLGKDTVSGVFLSDDKTDYKGVIVEQAADKIVMKIPQVQPGRYNISIQTGNKILILPVRFDVQQ